MPITDIALPCPMGHGPDTLHLMGSGLVECLDPECPNPGAVNDLLTLSLQHKVWLTGAVEGPDGTILSYGGHAVEHPLRERLERNGIVGCPLNSLLGLTWPDALEEHGEGVFYVADRRMLVPPQGTDARDRWDWTPFTEEHYTVSTDLATGETRVGPAADPVTPEEFVRRTRRGE